jgi:PAS domain S-box-containing protein
VTPEQFLELARVLPEPLLLITGDGRILAANPSFATMLAMRGDTLHDKLLADLVSTPPDAVRDYLRACARSRAMVLGSLTFQTPDGRAIVTRSEGGVIRPWSKGAPALILLRFQPQEAASSKFLLLNRKIEELSREIRERRRAQDEIYRQREHLRVTLSSIGDAVIATDVYGNISFMNPVAEFLTGWSQEQAIGKPLDDVFKIVNEFTRETVENPVAKVLREGIIVGLANHTLLLAKDGTERPIDDSGAPIADADGTLIGVVLVFRDVTERKRSEERQGFLAEASTLLASSLDYQTTLDRIARIAVPAFADACLVDMLESDGSIQRTAVAHSDPNQQRLIEQLRQEPTDSSTAYGYLRVIHTGQSELIPDIASRVLATSAQDGVYLQQLTALGAHSLICVPLVRRGRTMGTLTFITTISKRRYTPEDLTLAEELAHRCAIALDNAQFYRQAQEAIQLRDSFLSVASHELKTPLTSLLGNAQLLKRRMARDGAFSQAYTHAIEVIVDQANRLNRMITALLDISRIQTGQLAIERRPMDICSLVHRIVAEVQPTLDKHTVVYHAPEGVLLIDGDELRLEQVMQNLLGNAIKYSPSGGAVVIRIEQQEGEISVAVSDQGIGIPEHELPNLFQRFYRASNADAQYMSGMGIGLFVVKEIVTLHNGWITVASNEGEGSRFTIWLPLYEE